MDKVVFSGCSMSSGAGWKNIENSINFNCFDAPDLWVNLCHRNIPELQSLELINVSNRASSNSDIFAATMNAIAVNSDIKFLFCQWTAMPRYNFSVGFELQDTTTRMQETIKHNARPYYRQSGIPPEKFNDLLDRLFVVHHLQGEIVKLIYYAHTVKQLCKKLGIKYVFINGLCPWDDHFFDKIDLTPGNIEDLTPFTKQHILNIDTRSDEEIIQLYELQHQQYQQVGGIDPADWVNLYNPFFKNKIDSNFDGIHPGTQTNKLFFNLVKEHMEIK
jgi:hypothetical protein